MIIYCNVALSGNVTCLVNISGSNVSELLKCETISLVYITISVTAYDIFASIISSLDYIFSLLNRTINNRVDYRNVNVEVGLRERTPSKLSFR